MLLDAVWYYLRKLHQSEKFRFRLSGWVMATLACKWNAMLHMLSDQFAHLWHRNNSWMEFNCLLSLFQKHFSFLVTWIKSLDGPQQPTGIQWGDIFGQKIACDHWSPTGNQLALLDADQRIHQPISDLLALQWLTNFNSPSNLSSDSHCLIGHCDMSLYEGWIMAA